MRIQGTIKKPLESKAISCRFSKAGRVWCGGVRETREPHVTIGRTLSKDKTAKNLPAFRDLSGRLPPVV